MLLFAPALADELVYQRTWRVDDAGATDERLVGSPTVRLASGREWSPTTTSLIDPDGRAYGVDWQVGQDIEGGATSIAMQVWRFDNSTSAVESEVPFENGDIDLLDSGVRGPAPVVHEAELSFGEGVEAWIEAGDDADTRALFLKVRDEEEFGPPPILEGLLDTDPVAYTGEAPSANSVQDDMYVVVADTCIDEDHPAWNDEGPFYNSRLGAVWRWDGGFRPLYSYEDSAEGDCHGMGVSSILLANLLDGQDLANRATPGNRHKAAGWPSTRPSRSSKYSLSKERVRLFHRLAPR